MATDRSFEAYQSFLLDTKRYWTRQVYPALTEAYRRRADDAARRGEPRPQTADEVAALMEADTLYQWFAWFERHLQRFKYSGRWGLVPAHEDRRADLESLLARDVGDLLTLDPDFDLPRYYTSVDIHQHPGGVWSDSLAGIVYERGARSTTPLMGRDADLHYRFTDVVLAEGTGRRLLDMGCGFGKSTRPFYTENRELEVTGIDLSAPCLKLAAVTAAEDQAANVRFVQADAQETGLADEGFDTVTSTMLLHEMPPPALERLVAESYRLLAPGGVAVHLDFLPGDDPWKAFIHYGHGRRNNEPFMRPLDEMDIARAHRDAGFREVEVRPFEEAPGALDPDATAWRFPWAVIVARK
jgi:ubiquinone/menaquinone biosynthesis C-methylase UbiE